MGKPSKGTPADKRLATNKGKAPAKGSTPPPWMKPSGKSGGKKR